MHNRYTRLKRWLVRAGLEQDLAKEKWTEAGGKGQFREDKAMRNGKQRGV